MIHRWRLERRLRHRRFRRRRLGGGSIRRRRFGRRRFGRLGRRLRRHENGPMLHGRHGRKIEERSRATTAAILCDWRALSKASANNLLQIVRRWPEQWSVVVGDLVEERIAQAV